MAHCGTLLLLRNLRAVRVSILFRKQINRPGRTPMVQVSVRALSCTPPRFRAGEHGTGQFDSGSSSDSSSSSDSDSGTTGSNVGGDEEYEHGIRQRILQAALPHVRLHGWTKKALQAGAESEGLPPIAQGMFPRGGADLVHYFYTKCNDDLAEDLRLQVEQREKDGEGKASIKMFVRDAMEARLRMIGPYLDTWPQAMAIQALPPNAPQAWSNLLQLSDHIWYHAGDRSVDFNWYTKRVSLAAVYKSSEIYMLQDKSEDLQDTWAFMDRRLKDVQTIGSARRKLEQNLGVLKEGLEASCTLGRNMLGMNSRKR